MILQQVDTFGKQWPWFALLLLLVSEELTDQFTQITFL